ncbi:MAG: phosphate starvation-inducible protein PhoH [Rhodospirillales bacterium]|nr:phosphate starvation-inducible protein PhoH [Rhodospirillales bacterium]
MAGDKNVLWFSDNRLLPLLFGEHDKFIARIEESLKLQISSRGNRISIVGEKSAVALATKTLRTLYQRLEKNLSVDNAEVDAAIRLASDERSNNKTNSILKEDISIRTPKAIHMPRSVGQVEYMHSLYEKQMIFGLGPAGTGKTYLAVAMAVSMLIGGEVDRIILSRPAVEAGERLGFLPGDLREKIDPYLAPLFDALHDMLPANQAMNRLGSGEIEVAPLAFMRGRTLSHSCVILDEGQNATKTQMKMFLTRIGEGSKMIITGDPSQVDLPSGVASGLNHAVHLLRDVKGVSVVRFGSEDVVRSRLVTNIVRAYESEERQEG